MRKLIKSKNKALCFAILLSLLPTTVLAESPYYGNQEDLQQNIDVAQPGSNDLHGKIHRIRKPKINGYEINSIRTDDDSGPEISGKELGPLCASRGLEYVGYEEKCHITRGFSLSDFIGFADGSTRSANWRKTVILNEGAVVVKITDDFCVVDVLVCAEKKK